MAKKTKNRVDVYELVTNYVIEMLEKVEVSEYETPFSMGAGFQDSKNLVSGKSYNGINSVVLWVTQYVEGFQSNEWATFKQWKEKGAKIKKGAKSVPVIYYNFYKTGETVIQNGKEVEEERGYIKYYRVFNADQVEGYEGKTAERPNFGIVEKVKMIDDFIANTGAEIKTGGHRAYYHLEHDYIKMPGIGLFLNTSQTATENYYATLLHELTHWTGAKTRNNRFPEGNGSKKDYAFEELVAELGSAFLCERFGMKTHGRKDHVAYIRGWLRALESDKKFIFKASTQAKKAVEFLEAKQNKQAKAA